MEMNGTLKVEGTALNLLDRKKHSAVFVSEQGKEYPCLVEM